MVALMLDGASAENVGHSFHVGSDASHFDLPLLKGFIRRIVRKSRQLGQLLSQHVEYVVGIATYRERDTGGIVAPFAVG